MSYTVSTLLLRNLRDVFGEIDPARRRAAIDEIYNEDCVFYDPTSGAHRGGLGQPWQGAGLRRNRFHHRPGRQDRRHLSLL